MKRRIAVFAVLTLTALLCAGCTIQTVEEMYDLPKRSSEYSQLQSAIDSAMIGLTYCAPISGDNQQSVQMADLDGDGVEEYLVFTTGDMEKPLQILIFTQEEDGTCVLAEVIASNGTAFEQVEYVHFDDQPGFELVIGRQVSDQILRSVSVYTFHGDSAEQQLAVGYSKFLTCDLDEDGKSEVMVLRPGEEETQRGMAVLYSMRDGQIERSVETELTESPGQIRRITVGKLHGGQPAVYVASATDRSSIVTDVFAIKDGRFTNIAFTNQANTDIDTLRNFYVYAEDIDEDGIMELPSMISMKALEHWRDGEQKYLLRWSSMDIHGNYVEKLFTFHYYLGGWYICLDSALAERITVTQEGGTYTVHLWDAGYQEATALYTIYSLTGSNRDEEAVKDGRFALYRAEGIAYAAKLEPEAAHYGITEETLIESFRLIRQDWRTGET